MRALSRPQVVPDVRAPRAHSVVPLFLRFGVRAAQRRVRAAHLKGATQWRRYHESGVRDLLEPLPVSKRL
jgi:hypothetical protein